MEKTRIRWIDCAKFVAICAVLFGHSYGVLYMNDKLSRLSFFPTPLFILISGITSYMSASRHNGYWYKIVF